jgi:serine/threonine protein phosphatase PrpC
MMISVGRNSKKGKSDLPMIKNVTVATRQGERDHQEDYTVCVPIKKKRVSGWLLAVMDGHGGKETAEFVARVMGKCFSITSLAGAEDSLRKLVAKLNGLTANFKQKGTTLSIVCVIKSPSSQYRAVIAVLGDSPVFIFDKYENLHMSPEHNVGTNVEERIAAEQRGGVYREGYLCRSSEQGDYAVQLSRALGDRWLDPFISHEPDIYTIKNPRWILVASDGLLGHGENSLREMMEPAHQRLDAESMVKQAESRGLHDNTTAIVWR